MRGKAEEKSSPSAFCFLIFRQFVKCDLYLERLVEERRQKKRSSPGLTSAVLAFMLGKGILPIIHLINGEDTFLYKTDISILYLQMCQDSWLRRESEEKHLLLKKFLKIDISKFLSRVCCKTFSWEACMTTLIFLYVTLRRVLFCCDF